jgi:GDP-L-fucose synthase
MKNVFIAGHNGMVGNAVLKKLRLNKKLNIITADRKSLDLLNQKSVQNFFSINEIDQVYICAAKVGGIEANNMFPADFIYQNLCIESNIIHACHLNNVNKVLFLGSSCIYPRDSKQPIKEEYLLTGRLEKTNEPYAISKIAGIKLCESFNRQYNRDYRSVMPTNLYGPYDNFHPSNSHVIPGLLRRFHEAKQKKSKTVIAWGTGKPMREFLHVDDLADASIFVMNLDKNLIDKYIEPMQSHINVGTGVDCSIKSLTEKIAGIVKFNGKIEWDSSKPDGTKKKLLDISLITKLGWVPSVSLDDGLKSTYQWYKNNINNFRS